LEDHLELSPAQCAPDQLISITKLLVSPNFEIRKEALDRFLESHLMLEEFVALEIILEVFGRESAPINHTPFYYGSAEKVRSATAAFAVRVSFFRRSEQD
jgi:hypothetical protein